MTMNKLKATLFLGIALLSVWMMTSCASEKTPYDQYNKDGYNVSVKYDANGGFFTTNTEVIVDSYKSSDLPTNTSGQKELNLLSPDNTVRGSGNAFEVSRSGYFLAGWYTERVPVLDEAGNPLDEDGKPVAESGKDPAYTYSGRWDFEKDRFQIDPNGTYRSDDPVVTLYAAWVPEFSYEFYEQNTGTLIGTYVFNPLVTVSEVQVPQWNEETGKIEMYHFPKVSGKTFSNVYLDAIDKTPVTDSVIHHPGVVDFETATATDSTVKLYVDMIDGEWFRISSAEQFSKNASVSGNYYLCEDLDFSDALWPTVLMYGNYTGKILGNGHTIRNVAISQTNNSKPYAGLFGQISAGASIENVTFENVTVTLEKGTRLEGARFGLLAGTIASSATLKDLNISNGTLQISSDCTFPNDFEIGLLCGLGSVEGIDLSGIHCEPVNMEDSLYFVSVEVDGNVVTVNFDLRN